MLGILTFVAVRKICFVCSAREMHHFCMTQRHSIHNHEELCQRVCVCVCTCSYLPQHQLSIHVHGEVTKVQQHLVCSELLLGDIIAVQHDDGDTQEQVEVVRLSQSTHIRTQKTYNQALSQNNQKNDCISQTNRKG